MTHFSFAWTKTPNPRLKAGLLLLWHISFIFRPQIYQGLSHKCRPGGLLFTRQAAYLLRLMIFSLAFLRSAEEPVTAF